jgi:hypothetical protein
MPESIYRPTSGTNPFSAVAYNFCTFSIQIATDALSRAFLLIARTLLRVFGVLAKAAQFICIKADTHFWPALRVLARKYLKLPRSPTIR